VSQGPSSIPFCGTHPGREGVAAFVRAVGETLAIKEVVPGVVVADGDRVAVIGYERGTAVPTGRPYASEWVHVFTFFDGQVIEFREYADTAALAEAFRGASRSAA
jgi:ketosteroid isomerase-like protein